MWGLYHKRGSHTSAYQRDILATNKFVPALPTQYETWWTFQIFFIFFFFCSGRGRGSPRRQEGAIGLILKIPGGGGGFPRGGGAEGPGGCLRRIGEFWGEGAAKDFFSGSKGPPSVVSHFLHRFFSGPKKTA